MLTTDVHLHFTILFIEGFNNDSVVLCWIALLETVKPLGLK